MIRQFILILFECSTYKNLPKNTIKIKQIDYIYIYIVRGWVGDDSII